MRLVVQVLVFCCIISPAVRTLARPQEAPFRQEVGFASGEVHLAGSLYIPSWTGLHPAVVLVHGDRPGARDWYRRYAEEFARRGVAALAYDRRGSGESGGRWAGARFEDLAGDARAAVRFLRTRPAMDRNRVGLWGISQGAWVSAIAAADSAEISFLISVSGAGMSPARQAVWLYENTLRRHEEPTALVAQGRRALAFFFEFLTLMQRHGPESLRANLPGFDLHHDPGPVLQRVKQPVLAIYGARDTSVPPRLSAEIFAAALERGGNPAWTLLIYADADHVLNVPGDPDARPVPGFLDTTAEWVRTLAAPDRTFSPSGTLLQPEELPAEEVPARPGWFGAASVQLGLLACFGLVFLSPLAAWPVAALIRRLRRGPAERGLRPLRIRAAVVSVWNLLLLAGLVRLIGGHAAFIVTAQYVAQRGFWFIAVGAALVSALLTAALVGALNRSSHEFSGRRAVRLHCAAVAVASIIFVGFLGYWRLLGL